MNVALKATIERKSAPSKVAKSKVVFCKFAPPLDLCLLDPFLIDSYDLGPPSHSFHTERVGKQLHYSRLKDIVLNFL